MLSRLSRDGVVAAVLIVCAVSLYFVLIPRYVPDSEMGAMSPRFFPKLGSLLIGLGGVVIGLLAFIQKNSNQSEKSLNEKSNRHLTGVLFVMALVLIFLLLFQTFGYLLSAPILVFGLMWVFGCRQWQAFLLNVVAAVGALYVLFNYGLGLPLE